MSFPLSCHHCAYRGACGGLDGDQSYLFGCFASQSHHECDFTCPCRPAEFRARLRGGGGLEPRAWQAMKLPSIALPSYVPIVRHGYGRRVVFDPQSPVGISLKDLFGRRRPSAYRPVSGTGAELRAAFRLAASTPMVLVSVAEDRHIEAYWAMRNVRDLAGQIASLGFAAMTVPNYSFFTDAPRTDVLFNRKRMMIVSEELSVAGQPVIPHLQAITSADWRFWEDILRRQPIVYVAKEFQTGLRTRELGLAALDELARLQDRLGRPLHPLVIGGAQYNADFAARFASHTVVDSQPFMTTVKRKSFTMIDGRLRRRPSRLGQGPLLEKNWRDYEHQITTEAELHRRPH